MTQIIDGRKIKNEILENIKADVLKLSFVPMFCDILVGADPVSTSYVRIKEKTAESVGIKFRTAEFNKDATTEEIISEIENLNKVPHMCGIIVQLPLPSHIDKERVLDSIAPELDVDCLGFSNSQDFYENKGRYGYPTALACMYFLDSLDLNLKDKNIVVLGQGKLVGLPVSHLLRLLGLEVTTVDNKTEDITLITKKADILISAIGLRKFIVGSMIKEGVVIIDAGTSEENGTVVGDVDGESVMGIASYLTPSPGGVGPVTVAMLLKNILAVANNKK